MSRQPVVFCTTAQQHACFAQKLKYRMTYKETIEYLYASAPLFQQVGAGAYKEGLETTRLLDAHFGHPHRRFATVHIAGTNGKGSCASTIAAILQAAGLRTGLYTSPHLTDFRERIRVNGEMISRERVVRFVEEERAFFEPLHPSFFELTTALALQHFAEEQIDIAVIETGLGGRLDCTNIIHPLVSIITNISLDHTQFLGESRAAIAAEKAGIIKHKTPVIIGESDAETRPVFTHQAEQMQAPIHFAEDTPQVLSSTMGEDGKWVYETRSFGTIIGELGGRCQPRNTNTLLCALEVLLPLLPHAHITEEHIRQGFAHVCSLSGLAGRWQTLQTAPHVVCDTGHNAGGWEHIGAQLRAQHCRTMRIIIGMAADKDTSAVLSRLPQEAVCYFTRASVKRSLDEQTLGKQAQGLGLQGKTYATVMQAYRAALAEAHPDDFIFVGGSTFVVADLLEGLSESHCEAF